MEYLGRLIAAFMAVILIIIFPLQYIAQLNSENIDILVDDRTHQFTENIRGKGYLDCQMYEEYIAYLAATGEKYEIDIQDIRPVYGEEPVATTSFPLSYSKTQTLSTHTHHDDCYQGSKHLHSGSSNQTYSNGCYTLKNSKNKTSYCSSPCRTIDRNHHNVSQTSGLIEWTCSNGNKHVTIYYSCSCGASGYNVAGSVCHGGSYFYHNYDYYSYCPGHSTTYSVYELGCGKTEGKYYDNHGNELSPICNRVVSSIEATNPVQSVDKGSPIITSAIATYLDGHREIVSCSDNYKPDIVGKQTVTLTYTGLVGDAKTTGTRSCTIDVTVKPVNILSSIIVEPYIQSIEKYSYPSFTVKAIYNDGSNKVLDSSMYKIEGFDPAYIGLQNLTISYTENDITKTAIAQVTVKPLQKDCPACNKSYDLNMDDTDPGCPYCREIITGIEVIPDYVEVVQGESLPITVLGKYGDGQRNIVDQWTSNYNTEKPGLQIVTVEYGGYAVDITVWVEEGHITCPICGYHYPQSENTCPDCAKKPVSITVSPNEVTVMQYDPIPLRVTAYYADGSSCIVDDWTIDKDTSIPGSYLATISYQEARAIISLTVLSLSAAECNICGTIYEVTENPMGCPICSKEPVGIEVYLTGGTNLVPIGTFHK